MRGIRRAAVAVLIALGIAPGADASPPAGGRISLFAGQVGGGFSGDGFAAQGAGLANPYGLAADARGNVYIADYANLRIRKVDPRGTITTIAGNGRYGTGGDGGPATRASLRHPRSITVDGRGSVYFADVADEDANQRIRMIDTAGRIHTLGASAAPVDSGDGGPVAGATFETPTAVAADTAGNLYVAGLYRIRKIDTAGIVTTIAGDGTAGTSGDGGPATAARLDGVFGLAPDDHGNLYVLDGPGVRKIDAAGTITKIGPAYEYPTAIAVGPQGRVYFADADEEAVQAIDPDGTVTTVVGGANQQFTGYYGAALRFGLKLPQGLALRPNGHLLIADGDNNDVLELSPPLSPVAAGRCTHAAARALVEAGRLGNSGFTDHPEQQVLCGHFTGPHSRSMVVSLSVPSCGLAAGWLVYRSVGGVWRKVPSGRTPFQGGLLVGAGSRIREWQGVLKPTDAHCFPSSARTRLWHWNGHGMVHGRWQRRARLPRHIPGLR
jgi:hypothetical protein